MDTQGCCTRRIGRCIFLFGSLAYRIRRIPPHISPDRYTRGPSGLSDRSLHFLKGRRLSGTVVQCKDWGTHTGHIPGHHGLRSQGFFPHGFLCSHIDLGNTHFIIKKNKLFCTSYLSRYSRSMWAFLEDTHYLSKSGFRT